MKTRKPRPKKFKDSTLSKVTVLPYGKLITLKVETYNGLLGFNPKTAFQLAQHIIHCALYVHEKYEKKE